MAGKYCLVATGRHNTRSSWYSFRGINLIYKMKCKGTSEIVRGHLKSAFILCNCHRIAQRPVSYMARIGKSNTLTKFTIYPFGPSLFPVSIISPRQHQRLLTYI